MDQYRPLIIIEDDIDDQMIMQEALDDLGLFKCYHVFSEPSKAIEYLTTTTDTPCLILCDLMMPKTTGLEFRRQLLSHPQFEAKQIPFILISSSSMAEDIVDEDLKPYVDEVIAKQHEFGALTQQLRDLFKSWCAIS
ncbi:response regulator [Chitinophaga rhizophila]|uniref:Response regulator n=1 Tax=Chitinophaga rhizophila TaxID=2866212 RepID=A0ABS7GHR6_9BACT|nr:response regulator [Chitinophaga rhizophila]MBW8687232.1 response regulator [Chitinophaga rhizophila]